MKKSNSKKNKRNKLSKNNRNNEEVSKENSMNDGLGEDQNKDHNETQKEDLKEDIELELNQESDHSESEHQDDIQMDKDQNSTESDNKKNMKRKLKGISIEILKIVGILALCALLGIFLAVGHRKGSSYRFAEEYFSYFISNNYEEMYKMTDTHESEFINLENFKTKCEGERVYGSVTGYKLSKPVKHGKSITYVVTYYVGPNKTAHTYTVTLNKQKRNNLLFFDRWKVSVSRFLIKNYKIDVPVGTEVIMDGVSAKKYQKQTSSDGTMDTYVIDQLFSGDHTVSVNLDATGEITKTQYVIKDNDSIQITTNDFAMKPDVQKSLFEYSAFVVKSMYEYSMDSTKNFADISLLYADDEKSQKSAENTFSQINAGIEQPDGASLRELNIKKLSPSIQSFTYPDKVVVKVDYDYDFNANSGTSELSGIVDNYNGSGNATSFVHLNLIDGAWKIVNVEITCVDYSKQG